MLPLISTLPKNCEPLAIDVTLKISSSVDAVTAPLAINGEVSDNDDSGILVNLEPSPANEPLNEPVNLFAITSLVVIVSVTSKLPVISTSPMSMFLVISGVEL